LQEHPMYEYTTIARNSRIKIWQRYCPFVYYWL